MTESLGTRFAYTAGFATREELADAPGEMEDGEGLGKDVDYVDVAGVVAAADDPPLTTIEPHLEMSYNKHMPGIEAY